MSRRVLVSSFSAQVLKNFHEVMPEVPIAFLYDTDTPASEWATIASVPHQAIHPRHTLVDAALMEKARADSHVVNTWTVNEPERAVELARLGVVGIITDNPDKILAALGR